MDGLFPNIFHGERNELREKYGLDPPAKRRSIGAVLPLLCIPTVVYHIRWEVVSADRLDLSAFTP
jgi:hypothetical protein